MHKTRYALQHAEGLDRAGSLHPAHIFRFPPELVEDAGDDGFRFGVVATNKHARPAALETGVDHACITN